VLRLRPIAGGVKDIRRYLRSRLGCTGEPPTS
jgi:hypothetical protein